MGGDQTVQPLLGKETIGPALMIQAASPTTASVTFAENAPQTHADPAVEAFEDPRWAAVLEVHKPTPQRTVQVVDQRGQRASRGATGLGTQCILQLLETLFAGPTFGPLEAIPQEGEAFPTDVHDLRFR